MRKSLRTFGSVGSQGNVKGGNQVTRREGHGVGVEGGQK